MKHSAMAHRRYKEHLLNCDEHSTVRLLQSLGNTRRVLRNDTARQIDEIERGCDRPCGLRRTNQGAAARDHCYADGDWQRGMLSLGPSIAFAKRIEPLEFIVADLLDEARSSISGLSSLEQE
jgi:NAD(P)H-dependent flavin oxidoreductase YrpB (nitropropane dioxygenase family)